MAIDIEPLSKSEVSKVRGFVQRVGAEAAAKAMSVHKQTLLGLLSGAIEVRPQTHRVIREEIAKGTLDSTPPMREHDAGRAQASGTKVRA